MTTDGVVSGMSDGIVTETITGGITTGGVQG